MKQEVLALLLAMYPWLLISWIIIGIATFFLLLRVTAPFGRHSSTSWGAMIDNRIAWFIMEFTVLVIMWLIVSNRFFSFSLPLKIIIGLFTLHYLNRSLIFPLRIRTNKKKMPVVIMLSAITFNVMNGFLLGFYFKYYASYDIEWLKDVRFISGMILFFVGMMINLQSDNILIHLRKKNEAGYQIPFGGLFKYISCPNLFGEIIEWLGFALLCWNLPALAFLIWTCANLIPRALDHHKWYRKNFADYPMERKALIPYLL